MMTEQNIMWCNLKILAYRYISRAYDDSLIPANIGICLVIIILYVCQDKSTDLNAHGFNVQGQTILCARESPL